jgi:hypothetical protein
VSGAELLFELISQRYERGATLITSNLPFDEWTETFGSDKLVGPSGQRALAHASYSASARAKARAPPAGLDSRSGRTLRRPVAGFSAAVDRRSERQDGPHLGHRAATPK